MAAKTQEQTTDEIRGIQNVQALYKDRTVEGNFDEVSVSGRVSKNTERKKQDYLEELEVVYGGSYLEKRASQFRENRETARKKKGIDLQMNYGKKMQGPMFWFIVMFVIMKDLFDVVFTLIPFLSLFSSIFSILIGAVVFFYLQYNDVSLTSRKAATATIVLLIEFIPIIAFLPTATISIFLIRHYENHERLTKLVSKGRWSVMEV